MKTIVLLATLTVLGPLSAQYVAAQAGGSASGSTSSGQPGSDTRKGDSPTPMLSKMSSEDRAIEELLNAMRDIARVAKDQTTSTDQTAKIDRVMLKIDEAKATHHKSLGGKP